jgi:hypothetical protein
VQDGTVPLMDAKPPDPLPDHFACSKCNQIKPTHPRRRGDICRECRNAIRREYLSRPIPAAKAATRTRSWTKRNPDRKKAQDRKQNVLWCSRWKLARFNAESRGVLFLLPIEEFIRLHRVSACESCGIALKSIVDGEGFSRVSRTLDRVDPDGPYSVWNCAVLCHLCNTIKNNATPEQVQAVASWFTNRAKASK